MARTEILTDDQAVKGSAFPIEIKVYEGGTQAVPSSAKLTVKDSSGSEVVTDEDMAIAAGSGTMSYTLASTHTEDLQENAILEVTYVLAGGPCKAVFFFDVVLNALRPNVVDTDLKAYAPLLASEIWSTQSNFDVQIQEAFRLVKRDIKNKGRRPTMLIDGAQVRELVIVKTFELVCFDFAKAPDDIWWSRYQKHEAKYKDALASLIVKYDEDESGTIDDEEKKVAFSQPTFLR
ncbi:MAG: hypothetical protein BWX98_01627 [Candidatus Aminicenantes bacterium ADurb.Bin147]|nr:MAG: hypothetical protein BWX98_01627 [Candidatus Aminicenantes bacterium ADurb.Bin147]